MCVDVTPTIRSFKSIADRWRSSQEPIDATGNVVIISVPSVVNPALAPEGRHCLGAKLWWMDGSRLFWSQNPMHILNRPWSKRSQTCANPLLSHDL